MRRIRRDADDGRATIEVIFLGILLLIPVTYLLISVFRVQAATLAVTQAARDAGRLIDTASDLDVGIDLAQRAAVVALTDQNVPADRVRIRFIAAGGPCEQGVPRPPVMPPGSELTICVTAALTLPGVPSVLTGEDNTVTGVYTLRVGEFREAGS